MADEQKKNGRKTNVTGKGKGLYKRGDGLGTGPVGSADGYAGKKNDDARGLLDSIISSALSGGMGGSSIGSSGSAGYGSHGIDLNNLSPAQQQQLLQQLQAMQQQQSQQQVLQQSQQSSTAAQQLLSQLLGQPSHSQQSGAGSLFGSSQSAQSGAGSLFGSQPAQPTQSGSTVNNILSGNSTGASHSSQGFNPFGSQQSSQTHTTQTTHTSSGGFGGGSNGGNGGSNGTIPFGTSSGNTGGKKKKSILPIIIIALLLIFVLPRFMSCGSNYSTSQSQGYSTSNGSGSGSAGNGQSASSNTANNGQSANAGTSNAGTTNNTAANNQTANAGTSNAGTSTSSGSFAGAASAAQNAAGASTASMNSGYGSLSSLFGGSSGNYDSWGNAEGNSSAVNTAVASGSRDKYTTILGGGQDTVTILVYMCGTDLESQSGMGTSDLMEMTKANIAQNVNLLVYTGGCKRWNNQVVSSSVNQIYKVETGGLARLVENAGSPAMTNPSTLAEYIQWGTKNYPANRYELILWDHGSGSVAGYCYDEKNASSGSMSLAGISSALKQGGVKFDFIGFDACLMSTAENALMLDSYADYLIASEETEPGVGWYYTDWLTALSANTSSPTLEIGKNIVDGFVATCARKCPGQKTTLSVIDLAEFANTVPDTLSAFATKVSGMVNGGQYQEVSNARYKAREFATSSKIDQVDLIDLANRIGGSESNALIDSLKSAIKYNRTSSDMTNAYGVAIYFPYRRLGYVDTAVKTYSQIGTPSAYSKCIQDVAGMTTSGQVASGGYSSPLGSLLGGGYGGSSSSSYGSSSSSAYGDSDMISALLSSFLGGDMSSMTGGSSGSSSYDYYFGRSIPTEDEAAYISEHMLNPDDLVWTENENGEYVLGLTDEDWANIHDLDLNVFYDDGEGYIDLGLDNRFSADDEGNLVADTARTWLAINEQIVPYYHIDTVDDGTNYKITGRVPVELNGERADLLIVFDNDHPSGYIAGATFVVEENGLSLIGKPMVAVGEGEEAEAEPLVLTGEDTEGNGEAAEEGAMTSLKEGDTIDFICDYYTYDGNYEDSYYLGETMTVSGDMVVSDVELPDDGGIQLTYRLTDLYDREYWTDSIEG